MGYWSGIGPGPTVVTAAVTVVSLRVARAQDRLSGPEYCAGLAAAGIRLDIQVWPTLGVSLGPADWDPDGPVGVSDFLLLSLLSSFSTRRT